MLLFFLDYTFFLFFAKFVQITTTKRLHHVSVTKITNIVIQYFKYPYITNLKDQSYCFGDVSSNCLCLAICNYYVLHSFSLVYCFCFQKIWNECDLSESCSAPLSLLVEEKRGSFNREKACNLVKDLKKVFNTGKTKTYEWRISQLTSMLKMIQENEADIYRALYQDLSKPQSEAFISEVQYFSLDCTKFILGKLLSVSTTFISVYWLMYLRMI